MSLFGVFVALILAVSTANGFGNLKSFGDAAPDPLERSAAMARAFGRNIHSIRSSIEEFEDTCTIHCMQSKYYSYIQIT